MTTHSQALSDQNIVEQLMHQDHFTVDELAQVLGVGRDVIHHAAFTGELRAFVIEHHCLDICREDVLDWLHRRDIRVA